MSLTTQRFNSKRQSKTAPREGKKPKLRANSDPVQPRDRRDPPNRLPPVADNPPPPVADNPPPPVANNPPVVHYPPPNRPPPPRG